jgi:catechol 2,3-dioxygenase-like lactoylglutathione lyase family enzyme
MTDNALSAQSLDASLTVADVTRSRDWYRDVLGFTVDREFARDNRLFAASMRVGTARILLAQDDGGNGTERAKGVGFSLQFTTSQDVDALAAHVQQSVRRSTRNPRPLGARVSFAFATLMDSAW